MPFIMKSLNNISRCQSVYRNSKIEIEGLSAAHHTFIMAICKHSGSTQEEISKDICLDKSTVARVLAHLEKLGYITRTPNEKDKRELLIFPTDKAKEVFPKIKSIAKEWNTSICDGISEEEMNVFYSVLSRIEQSAKSVVDNLRGGDK